MGTQQLLGMIRYELLMAWRRGSSRVILVVIAGMPLLAYFAFVSSAYKQAEEIAQLTADGARWYRTAMTISDNVFLIPVIIFLVPLLYAETIPLDRQWRVRELLGALPLPRGGYLAGKMLAVWASLTATLLVAAAINVGMSLAYRGSFEVGPLAMFWTLGLGLMTLFGSQMGVMLAASQPDRRRAILMGMLAIVISFGGFVALPAIDILWAGFIQAAFIPGHPTIDVSRYPAYPDLASPLMLGRIALVALVMAAVWQATVRLMERAESS